MSTNEKSNIKYIRENREEIGRQIRLLREKKGFSLDQLAERMDANRDTIFKIETGKFAVTIDFLAKLSQYLDFNIMLLDKQEA